MFQQAAKKAFFEQIPSSDHLEDQSGLNQDGQFILEDISEEEFERIVYWSKILRGTFITVSSLMVACSWYNMATAYNSVENNFLALYLFMMSMLLCCYEIALRQVALLIVQNFGFMYSLIGRAVFIIFVAVIAFQLSTFGIVCFAFLIASGGLEVYVRFMHPKYGVYLQKKHYYHNVAPKTASGGRALGTSKV